MCRSLGPVTWINGDGHAAAESTGLFSAGFLPGCQGGWQLKAYSIAHSRFAEVLYLDADCYPVADPAALFDSPHYHANGAIFWPDGNAGPGNLTPAQYAAFGVTGDGRGWESGQIVLDKRRHWKSLHLALWLNANARDVYQVIYGDKDTFQMAWRATGAARFVHDGRPHWQQVAFVHVAPDGTPLFVHRCRDKFRTPDERFGSTPQNFAKPQFVAALPGEERAHRHYAHFLETMKNA